MLAHFDFDEVFRSADHLFRDGLPFTLLLTTFATLGGFVLGTLLAIVRVSAQPVLTQAAAIYVNVLRSLPLVLVIFWLYFLAPYLGQWIIGAERPVAVGVFPSALVTFTLFEAAYFAEIARAGIKSVSRGQLAAAHALGLNQFDAMRFVILPQAFRNMLPMILTQVIVLFQDTSLVYVLSASDVLGTASKVAHRDGRLVEMYLFAASIYFVISLAGSIFVANLRSKVMPAT